MLQVSYIRDNKEKVITALAKRNMDVKTLVEEVIQLDENRRSTQVALDNTLAEANKLSSAIGDLMKSGEKAKAEILKLKTVQLKETSKELAEKSEALANELLQKMYLLPNLPADIVPVGKTPEDNQNVFEEGTIPVLHEGAQPHWELVKKYDIIDFELGVKITGAGFPVYKGKGAKLQRALISYFLDKNTEAGYQEFQVPHLVNEASAYGTGQLPDKEGQMYHDASDDLYLIPTAEVPVTNIFRDVILQESELPILCTGYTPCFRREAGSYGAHVRGLNRLHQFDKVEIVRIEKPENSYAALDRMVEHVKEILHELKYGFKAQLGVQLGKWMGNDWLQKNQNLKIDAFIPVPIHSRKKFNRGYNQSEQLAKGIASILNVPVDCNFIRKIKNTKSQTKKSIFHRRINVENVFKLNKKWCQYKHIALVDDVVTTGATLEAMIAIINKRYPALEISIFVLAMAK